jgi:hypothetical protein
VTYLKLYTPVQKRGYELKDLGFGFRQGKGVFFSPNCPYHLWGPHILLFNGYCIFTPELKQLERDTLFHLVSRLRIGGVIPTFSLCISFMAWTGTVSYFSQHRMERFRKATRYYRIMDILANSRSCYL